MEVHMSEFALLMIELLQQRDIASQRAALAQLRERLQADSRRAREADEQLVELWSEVLDLRLYLAAAFRLLVDKGVVTAVELLPDPSRFDIGRFQCTHTDFHARRFAVSFSGSPCCRRAATSTRRYRCPTRIRRQRTRSFLGSGYPRWKLG
jgi:hypothetical protein